MTRALARFVSDSFLRWGSIRGKARYIMVRVETVQEGMLNGLKLSMPGISHELDIVSVVTTWGILRRIVL